MKEGARDLLFFTKYKLLNIDHGEIDHHYVSMPINRWIEIPLFDTFKQ